MQEPPNNVLEMQQVLDRVITLAERSGVEKRANIRDAIALMRESLLLLQYERRSEERRQAAQRSEKVDIRRARNRRRDDR